MSSIWSRERSCICTTFSWHQITMSPYIVGLNRVYLQFLYWLNPLLLVVLETYLVSLYSALLHWVMSPDNIFVTFSFNYGDGQDMRGGLKTISFFSLQKWVSYTILTQTFTVIYLNDMKTIRTEQLIKENYVFFLSLFGRKAFDWNKSYRRHHK